MKKIALFILTAWSLFGYGQKLVKKVGQRVVQNSSAKNTPYQYDFHLLADAQVVNAFALPGGQVFITAALFNNMQESCQSLKSGFPRRICTNGHKKCRKIGTFFTLGHFFQFIL